MSLLLETKSRIEYTDFYPIFKKWSLNELEEILYSATGNCANECVQQFHDHDRVHITISGGLDSSLILAMIRRAITERYGKYLIPNTRVYSFTLGRSKKHPDVRYAKIAAKKFSTESIIIIPDNLKILSAKLRFERALPELAKNQPGSLVAFMLYEYMAKNHFVRAVIAHDGIDELMGGYWPHRQYAEGVFPTNKKKMEAAFEKHWQQLEEKHLIPLEAIAEHFGIHVFFPYLQKEVVEYITRIPLTDRTSHDVSKIPLREIAKKYGVPRSIIQRPKVGFCDALKDFTK